MSVKGSNPKDAVGVHKAMFSAIPAQPLGELARAMQEGALKYGRHNWRASGVRYSVYYDAALRHLMAWWEGEDIDPDSGVHHLMKCVAGLMVLRDGMLYGNAVDDRPPKLPSGWLEDINREAAALNERFREPAKPITHEDVEED